MTNKMANKMTNNTGDDYLWDKTGEPDPEMQELEQVMGTLRFQPRPLEIPEGLQPGHRRVFIQGSAPRWAIAAAIALVALGAGLWWSLERRDPSPLATIETKPPANTNSVQAAVTVPPDVQNELGNGAPARVPGNTPMDRKNGAKSSGPTINTADRTRRDRLYQTTIAANANRRRALEPKTSDVAASELREAEAAKAQLMLALRVASSKLNLALKKAPGVNTGNLIHNQHKVG